MLFKWRLSRYEISCIPVTFQIQNNRYKWLRIQRRPFYCGSECIRFDDDVELIRKTVFFFKWITHLHHRLAVAADW